MVGQPLDALRRPLTASQANRVYGQEVPRPQLSVHAEVDAHDLTAALVAWLPTSPKPTSEPALKLDDVAAPPRPNLYCRSGTLGGATLATANLTVWEAALQCNNRSLFDGKCAGWTTQHVYPASCEPNSTRVFAIQFKDRLSLGKPVVAAAWTWFKVSRHDIAAVWVAFFSRWQRYRRWQAIPLHPPPPPLPPLPPPPPPPAPGVVRLSLLPGRPVEPYLFGWDGEGWTDAMFGTSYPYSDTGGMALTEALSPGVLRYPGGTGSNVKQQHFPDLSADPNPNGSRFQIWNMTSGRFMSAPPGAHGYSAYGPIAKFDNALPDGMLGAAAYLQGLGGVAKRAVWNLNVFVKWRCFLDLRAVRLAKSKRYHYFRPTPSTTRAMPSG